MSVIPHTITKLTICTKQAGLDLAHLGGLVEQNLDPGHNQLVLHLLGLLPAAAGQEDRNEAHLLVHPTALLVHLVVELWVIEDP